VTGAGAGAGAGLETGTDFVPYTGVYQLHKGEKVVPKPYADRDRDSEGKQLVIYNLMTPESVARAMQSKSGKNVIVNTMNFDATRSNGPTRRAIQNG